MGHKEALLHVYSKSTLFSGFGFSLGVDKPVVILELILAVLYLLVICVIALVKNGQKNNV